MKTGPEEAITGTLILSVFAKPKKKKEIFIVIPKKPTNNISSHCLAVSFCHLFKAKGKNINPAKKKRINAKVKGGILVKANLKIGLAIPQMMLAMIKARMGFIRKFSITNLQFSMNFHLINFSIKTLNHCVIQPACRQAGVN